MLKRKCSHWICPYHACMTDDCQKEEVLKHHPEFGKGECEKPEKKEKPTIKT